MPFETSLEVVEGPLVPPQTVSAAVVVAAVQGVEAFLDLEIFLEEAVEGLQMTEPKVPFPLAMMSFTLPTVEEILTKELENCVFPMDFFAKTG